MSNGNETAKGMGRRRGPMREAEGFKGSDRKTGVLYPAF